jgi:hypothetical protein
MQTGPVSSQIFTYGQMDMTELTGVLQTDAFETHLTYWKQRTRQNYRISLLKLWLHLLISW